MKKENIEFNWPLIGNEHIVEFLSGSIVNGKVSGSYIFCGPDNLGKTTVANYFAKSLVCTGGKKNISPCGECPACQQVEKGIYGDINLIKKEKDKKNISIEQIREIIKTLGLSSFLNSYKIGIIKQAETLTIEALNALLKTLEEPKAKVVIILITSNIEALPATIVSRSQILKFHQVKPDIIYDYLIKSHKASRSEAKNFSRLCLGRPALAVKFLEDKDFYENYKSQAEAFLKSSICDINGRFAAIEEVIGKEPRGQESVKLAMRTIEVWQGLVRDLMLLEWGEGDLIQHHIYEDKLSDIKTKFTPVRLANFMRTLDEAKEYLRANVNPKLVLENIAINL